MLVTGARNFEAATCPDRELLLRPLEKQILDNGFSPRVDAVGGSAL
jgi:hypothetical protein